VYALGTLFDFGINGDVQRETVVLRSQPIEVRKYAWAIRQYPRMATRNRVELSWAGTLRITFRYGEDEESPWKCEKWKVKAYPIGLEGIEFDYQRDRRLAFAQFREDVRNMSPEIPVRRLRMELRWALRRCREHRDWELKRFPQRIAEAAAYHREKQAAAVAASQSSQKKRVPKRKISGSRKKSARMSGIGNA
jgi:hypothetical protein